MPIYYILLGIFQDILLYLLKVSQGPLSLLVVIFSNVLAVGIIWEVCKYKEEKYVDTGLLIVSFVVSIYMIWSYYKAGV